MYIYLSHFYDKVCNDFPSVNKIYVSARIYKYIFLVSVFDILFYDVNELNIVKQSIYK